jgi:hypothetical protein
MSSYEPRTIAFVAEVLHPPRAVSPHQVQAVHNALFTQPRIGYQNFQVAADGIHLTNPPQTPGQVSAVTFQPDRTVVREEFRATTVEDFAARLVNVLGTAYRTLEIPQSIAQLFCIRSLINPQHTADSRRFVAERLVLGLDQAVNSFERPLHSAGLRLTFQRTERSPLALTVRVEPWLQEPRSLWLEVVGQAAGTIDVDNLPELGNYLYSTYRFLTGPLCDWIARFDQNDL